MTDAHRVPEPVTFEAEGATIHGQLWPAGGAWVVLVHESGESRDLDCWQDLPALLAEDGFSVLSFDLPGHGLSTDEWSPLRGAAAVETALTFAGERGADHRFLVVAGDSSGSAFAAHSTPIIDALVLLSPRVPESSFAMLREITSPKLVLAGTPDAETATAERIYRMSRGWVVLSRMGCPESGTELLTSAWGTQVREQVLAFLRDYR